MFDYDTLVAFSKSWGLFYLMLMAAVVTVYALWPGNRDKFDAAKHSILQDDETP
jgi:cytochrome c oxidase cbb3-type subunit 4